MATYYKLPFYNRMNLVSYRCEIYSLILTYLQYIEGKNL